MRSIQMNTERLTIRYIEENDWKSIQSIWLDFKQSEYVIYDNYKETNSESVKQRIAKWTQFTQSGIEHIFFTVCLGNEVIGYVSLNIEGDGYEIGYGFLDKVHGKGYARESITAILDYMKKLGVKRIVARTALKNVPSVRLLESLEFKLTGTEQMSFYQDSEGKDIYFEGGIFDRML